MASRNNNDDSSVRVAVRVRPMLNAETGSTTCIEVLRGANSDSTNVVRIGGESGPTFAFDEAFPGNTMQGHVFEKSVAPLVQSCMDGYNATVLAYGQTGSGKTHTMMGPSSSVALHDDMAGGVIPRAFRDLFSRLEQVRQQCSMNKENQPQDDEDDDDSGTTTYEYEVRVQFLELYGEEIRDLLTSKATSERLTIRDVGLDGEPEIVGAIRHKVETAEDALLCLTRGMMRRVTGATAMNETSSRSHAILSVLVEQTTTTDESACGGDAAESSHQVQHVEVKRSKFNFVDLAGSERQKRTQAEGRRLKEGIDINKGLLVLGNVISALGDPKKVGKSFVPYRDSKLTRLLKGSLGGNHKTLMIACVSPSSNNLEESLNCLRYANRAKNIQNNAVVNVDAGSRLVSELRQQVQALATDFLRSKEGNDGEGVFSVDVLKALASGSDSTGIFIGSRPASASIAPSSPSNAWDASNQSSLQQSNTGTTEELERTREKLRQAKVELLTTSESLHVTKAEKELYRLQVSATSTGEAESFDMDKALLERTAAYEKEISSLKEALRKASIPLELGIAPSSSSESPRATRGEKEPGTPKEHKFMDSTIESPEFVRLHSSVLQSISHSDQLEAEEQAECTEIATITSKYLDDDEPMGDVQGAQDISLQQDLGNAEIEGSLRQTQKMEAHLLEISRSIDAKEELINQLQLSQEKYSAMREFYENKLQHMEEQVRERESEREELVQELQKVEESNSCTKDLQARLKDKERHIAGLRKKQKELVSLTRVSSRNESEIGRLRNDVVTMKQKKVELQKLVTSERKSHAIEIQRLKKQAIQREREATKWKRAADKKAMEAEKAQQVAKARLAQVSQLRSKYKDAERQLRVRVVKRGVMEKAGLDSVIVGRRDSKQRQMASGSSKARGRNVDFDAVRGFLDQKIAEVGRKEAIADKLANEWEDHLELVSQREASVRSPSSSKETIDALDVQIQYKEERIRQLARRLGKVEKKDKGANDQLLTATFLEEKQLTSILREKSPLVAAKVAARVLFGMVVRERRRVASLARTASSLDEKAVEAEKAAFEKDVAFRSYMEEEQRERESLAQSQQEQILSLMSMVQEQENALSSDGEDTLSSTVNSPGDENKSTHVEETQSSVNAGVMVLANERISALQSQLHELQTECKALEGYKEQEAEARALLSSKKEETDELRKQLNLLRSSLRQIRETMSSQSAVEVQDEELSQAVLGIVMEALHPSRSSQSSRDRKQPAGKLGSPSPRRPKAFSPRLKRHVELMHTSDSEGDGEVPDWAGDIMMDLAIIAEDRVPPSLRNVDVSPAVSTSPVNEKKTRSGSVFDRLTNPDSFTGVQKQKTTRPRRSKQAAGDSINGMRGGQEERLAVSRSVTESLEKVVIPEEKSRPSSTEPRDGKELFKAEAPSSTTSSAQSDDSRSVFDRLLSPSNYTGTQKEKVQKNTRHKEVEHDTEEEPDAVLDELLGSDGESFGRPPFPTDEYTGEQLHSKVSDYTQQDVFERLQRTTTQSYAVKHSSHPPIRSPIENSHEVHTEEVEVMYEEETRSESAHVDHSEYYRQNVFERLQKTTTHSYSKKTKSGEGK